MLFQRFEKRDPQYADIYEHKYGTRSTGIRLVKLLVETFTIRCKPPTL